MDFCRVLHTQALKLRECCCCACRSRYGNPRAFKPCPGGGCRVLGSAAAGRGCAPLCRASTTSSLPAPFARSAGVPPAVLDESSLLGVAAQGVWMVQSSSCVQSAGKSGNPWKLQRSRSESAKVSGICTAPTAPAAAAAMAAPELTKASAPSPETCRARYKNGKIYTRQFCSR